MAIIQIEKLPDLRFVKGILQQQSKIIEYVDSTRSKITFVWNDVESFEKSPDVHERTGDERK